MKSWLNIDPENINEKDPGYFLTPIDLDNGDDEGETELVCVENLWRKSAAELALYKLVELGIPKATARWVVDEECYTEPNTGYDEFYDGFSDYDSHYWISIEPEKGLVYRYKSECGRLIEICHTGIGDFLTEIRARLNALRNELTNELSSEKFGWLNT